MHTFFINTSKKSLDGWYDVLFDIHYENKAFVSMDYPLDDWYDKEKGYLDCIKKMSDMIDGYVELNNAYNLIIYIDLSENDAYSSIKKDAFHDKDRDACLRAMHILFTHAISESIVAELSNSGRKPQNVLVMFGENKRFADFTVSVSDPDRPYIMKNLFDFIGLPETSVVEEIAQAVCKGEATDKINEFKLQIEKKFGKELIPGIREGYSEKLYLWYDEIVNEENIKKANDGLFNRISDINRVESNRIGIEITSCPYDCYACTVNKSALALSILNIGIYLLKCIEAGTIYDEENFDSGTRKVMEFYPYKADEIAPFFKTKESIFAEKAEAIENLTNLYQELGLAPVLRDFDHRKFSLDEFGDKDYDLVIKSTKESDDKEDKGEDETIFVKGNIKELEVEEPELRSLFSEEEFKPFDYTFEENGDKMLKKNVKPEEYIEQAINVRRHHLDYLKKLKVHISAVLSNYAGKSKQNKAALLQMGGFRYATSAEEKRMLEEVEAVADKSYETMLNQYMEFCSGRTVAITDIEEQCNWFISRINQIRESLNRIKFVALGILIAIIVLYIPFVVIQFEAIVENLLTFSTALGSVLIPIVILYLVFGVLCAVQKRKYLKAWLEFKKKSDALLQENANVAKKYDMLLNSVIPALRWVYEYKLDVDFCAECCNIADAKVEHHRKKLRNRVTAIQNILSDLEYNDMNDVENQKRPEITQELDYNSSFCSGKQNKKFYSIVDESFFEYEENLKEA